MTGSELEGVSQQLSSDVDALAWSTGTALAVATANKQIQAGSFLLWPFISVPEVEIAPSFLTFACGSTTYVCA